MPLTTCPECHTAMKVVARGEVLIDVCPSCRGVWLDGGELEKIMADTRQHEAERLSDAHRAEGRVPAFSGTAEMGKKKRDKLDRKLEKKRKKKKARFDLGDLGDIVEGLFD